MTTAVIAAGIPQTLSGPAGPELGLEFGPQSHQAREEFQPSPVSTPSLQEGSTPGPDQLASTIDQSTQAQTAGRKVRRALRTAGLAVGSTLAIAGPAEAQQPTDTAKPPETPKPHLVYIAKETPATLTRMVVDRVAPGQTLTPGLFVFDNTGLRLRSADGQAESQSEGRQFSQDAQNVLDEAGKLALKGMTPYLPGKPKANNMTVENGVITGVTYDCPSPDKKASLPTIQTLKLQSNGALSEATFCANNKVDFQMQDPNIKDPKVAKGVEKFINDPARQPLGGDYAKDLINFECSQTGDLADPFPSLGKSKGGIKISFNSQVNKYCNEAGVNYIETQGFVKKPGQLSKKVGKPVVSVMGLKEIVDISSLGKLTKNKLTVTTSSESTKKTLKQEFCKGKDKKKITYGFTQNLRFQNNPQQDYTTVGGYSSGKYKIKIPTKKLC